MQLRLQNFKKLQFRGREFRGGEGGWGIKREDWPVSREFSVILVYVI